MSKAETPIRFQIYTTTSNQTRLVLLVLVYMCSNTLYILNSFFVTVTIIIIISYLVH
jgi:hypothetical protein